MGEIAIALLLLLTTTILLQNLVHLEKVQPGFNPDSVFQARISIPPAYKSPQDIARFYDRLSERLLTMPGVKSVGVTSIAPLSGLFLTVPFNVEGPQHERDMPSVNLRLISPGFLPTVGTRLLHGRQFSETDRWDTPPVALVTSALAERFLGNAALGRRIWIDDNNSGPRPIQVVGVVEDVRQAALDAPPTLDLYVPLRQVHPDAAELLRNNQFWMIRTATAAAAFRSSFLAELRAVDPDAAIAGAGAMRDYVDATLGPRCFNLGLIAGFSLAGVLLAVTGLYGLVSYAVSQREPEIGLRMAIGASQTDIRRMILSEAALLGLAGCALGGCLAASARPWLTRLAPDASIPLVPALLTTALLLLLVTMAAWLPAQRATRISPILAL